MNSLKTIDKILNNTEPCPVTPELKRMITDFLKTTPVKNLTIKRLDAMAKFIPKCITNVNTRGVFFSSGRTILKKRFSDNPDMLFKVLKVYTAGLDDYNVRKEKFNQAILDKKPLEIKLQGYLELLKYAIDSKNPYLNIIGVVMAVGSRPIEIVEMSSFEAIHGNEVKITGLAKTRDREMVVVRPVVGITPKKLLETINYIRSNVENLNYTHAGALRRAGLEIEMNPRKAREMYVSVAYYLFGDKDAVTRLSFANRILGHDSISATQSYEQSSVVDEADARILSVIENSKLRFNRWNKS